MSARADDAPLVPGPPQRMQHVVLGAELVDLRLAHAAYVLGRDERLVDHQQDPVLPLHKKNVSSLRRRKSVSMRSCRRAARCAASRFEPVNVRSSRRARRRTARSSWNTVYG